MLGPDPVLTLHLPRSVVLACLAALGKQPLEQALHAHGTLAAEAGRAEEAMVMQAIAAKLSPAGEEGPKWTD